MAQFFQAGPASEYPLSTLLFLERYLSIQSHFVALDERSIHKNGTGRFASRAAFHLSTGCTAQVGGQVLTSVGKTCPLWMSFTNCLLNSGYQFDSGRTASLLLARKEEAARSPLQTCTLNPNLPSFAVTNSLFVCSISERYFKPGDWPPIYERCPYAEAPGAH